MAVVTKEIKTATGILKIHGIQTGSLAIKKKVQFVKKPGTLSTLFSFWDKEYGDCLPIWTWLIEHPEGLFLIDTGISTEIKKEGFFKKIDFVSRYYCEKQMLFKIEEQDELDNQLKTIGIDCNSIDKVLLTHLHIDHTGGLKYFPKTPVLVSEWEWKTKDSSFPQLFPKGINFEQISLDNQFENFEKAAYLTKTKDLIMVATPGHTRGHSSVILKLDDTRMICFGGDVAYNEQRLIGKTFSATIQSLRDNQKSCDQVLDLAKNKRVIFLPTHDTDNTRRLTEEIELKLTQ